MNKIYTILFCCLFGASLMSNAQSADNLNYDVGDELINQSGGSNWGGPWLQRVPGSPQGDNGAIAAGGITTIDGLQTSGNHYACDHSGGDTDKRFFRPLSTAVTDDGNTYWLSFFMQNSWAPNSGSVSYVMLVDSTTLGAGGPGGQLLQIGRRFSN
ncbi:MAG: hypothetical protein AAFO94_22340, partial [Bacteroidota bacterium]